MLVRIVVCVKQVIDPSFPLVIEGGRGEIEAGLEALVLNPADLTAVQEAVAIRDWKGGEVTVVTLGPAAAEKVLRRSLAAGANGAVHLRHAEVENLDCFWTGAILAAVIGPMEPDLVLCGARTSDWGSGLIGAVLAEELRLPLVAGVAGIDLATSGIDALRVLRKVDQGGREVIDCPLPVLLTVEEHSGADDHPPLSDHLRSLRQEVQVVEPDAQGFDRWVRSGAYRRSRLSLGPPVSRQKKVFAPDSSLSLEERMRLLQTGGVALKTGDMIRGRPEELAVRIVAFLRGVMV